MRRLQTHSFKILRELRSHMTTVSCVISARHAACRHQAASTARTTGKEANVHLSSRLCLIHVADQSVEAGCCRRSSKHTSNQRRLRSRLEDLSDYDFFVREECSYAACDVDKYARHGHCSQSKRAEGPWKCNLLSDHGSRIQPHLSVRAAPRTRSALALQCLAAACLSMCPVCG